MNLYRRMFPEKTRVKIRNFQYILDHIYFKIKFFINQINKDKIPNQKKYSKPSICYLIPNSNISGGVAVVCEHLNRLKEKGYKTLITSLDNKTNLSWFPKQKVKVIPFKKNKKNIEKYDVVVATGWITAYELALLKTKRKIYFVQSDETRFYPDNSFLKKRVELTYKMSYEFITEAKWIKKWLKKKYKKDAFYVPNGVNTKIFHKTKPLKKKPKNKKRILLEGAINLPFKGMKEAFKAIKDLDCEVWCVSYDGKPQPDWRCDKFFEKIPMKNMKKIYSSCDILLKMSKVEGFFGPPLEMMACGGVPVVSKVTGYAEYIRNGYNALVVEPEDIEGAKKAIKKLLDDQRLYKKLKKGAVETVKKWGWNESIKCLLKYYK